VWGEYTVLFRITSMAGANFSTAFKRRNHWRDKRLFPFVVC
jgi:hypothetical protein